LRSRRVRQAVTTLFSLSYRIARFAEEIWSKSCVASEAEEFVRLSPRFFTELKNSRFAAETEEICGHLVKTRESKNQGQI
jgi:hypothetical protein